MNAFSGPVVQHNGSMSVGYPNYMAMFGATLIANGYPIIPIQPGMKSPGRFVRGEWSNYAGWSRHCDRATTDFEVDVWSQWPSCAIGLAAGSIVGVDIDITDAEVAYNVEKLARLYLGETPCIRIGNRPKRLLVYRAAAPFASRKTKPLEILAHGTQFVIHSVHPDTQQPYEWPEQTLVETDAERLPEITEDQVANFYAEAWKIIPAEMKRGGHDPNVVPAPYVGSAGASLHGKTGTVEAVKAALDYIPNAGLDRADWIGIGMGIKGALGDAGRDLFVDWSRSSNKSGASGKSDTPERTWKSLNPRSKGAGSIYHRAILNGWRPAPDLKLNGDDANLPIVDLSQFLASLAADTKDGDRQAIEEAERVQIGIPPDLMAVDGVLGMLTDECIASAPIRSQPFLALGAAICAVGALAGRRYCTATDLRSNIYIVACAESGSGKDHAMKVIQKVFTAAGLSHFLGGKPASGNGLMSSLAAHPSRLYQIDELGLWLQEVIGPKAQPHVKAVKTNLMDLFSRANGIAMGTEYADQKQRERQDIQQPHVCLYGATTPATFWEALEGGALRDGFVARLMLFETDNNRPPRNTNTRPVKASRELIEACLDIACGPEGAPKGEGNLMQSGVPVALPKMSASAEFTPHLVPMSVEAQNAHTAWLSREDAMAVSVEGTHWSTAVNRWAEHAMKLALIRAVSRCPLAPVITELDVDWGWRLSEYCLQTLRDRADKYVSSNEVEANVKRVLNAIKEGGKDKSCVTLKELCLRVRTIRSRERTDIINDLLEQCIISETLVRNGSAGRPTKVYAYCGISDDEGD